MTDTRRVEHHPYAHEISRPRILTISTGPHIMGSDIGLEAGKVAHATPHADAFSYPFSLLSIPLEVLTVCKEEVGGVETYEMDILGPHTSSIARSLRSVTIGKQGLWRQCQRILETVQR
jgi:hypothetical protein